MFSNPGTSNKTESHWFKEVLKLAFHENRSEAALLYYWRSLGLLCHDWCKSNMSALHLKEHTLWANMFRFSSKILTMVFEQTSLMEKRDFCHSLGKTYWLPNFWRKEGRYSLKKTKLILFKTTKNNFSIWRIHFKLGQVYSPRLAVQKSHSS